MRPLVITASIAAAACLILTPAYAAASQHGRPANAGARAPSSIGQRIATRPQLASRLEPLLPAGATLETSAEGFRNEGEFIAALHVSHNLGIPFEELKDQMVDRPQSLGQAIHTLKPGADTDVEVKRAEVEAKADIDADRDRH
jgi:hypothetical protein